MSGIAGAGGYGPPGPRHTCGPPHQQSRQPPKVPGPVAAGDKIPQPKVGLNFGEHGVHQLGLHHVTGTALPHSDIHPQQIGDHSREAAIPASASVISFNVQGLIGLTDKVPPARVSDW